MRGQLLAVMVPSQCKDSQHKQHDKSIMWLQSTSSIKTASTFLALLKTRAVPLPLLTVVGCRALCGDFAGDLYTTDDRFRAGTYAEDTAVRVQCACSCVLTGCCCTTSSAAASVQACVLALHRTNALRVIKKEM